MKRYGCLFKHIANFKNLLEAARKALRGSKKFKKDAVEFYFDLENQLIKLETELRDGTYRPRPYTTFTIYEPKRRKICAAHFRDRVVHHAFCNVLEPLWDRTMIYDTYACRKNKGMHRAVQRAQYFSRRFPYFLKADIRKYFETIDHHRLKKLLERKIKDIDVLKMLQLIIDHSAPGSIDGKGVPIGNLTSQLFANLYLGELDHYIKERLQIKAYIRYMDDFIIFGHDKKEMRNYLDNARVFIENNLLLEIKDDVTRIAPIHLGLPFLGLRVFPNLIRLQRSNLVRIRRKIAKRERQFREGAIDEDFLIRSVGSMLAHISHADTYHLRRDIFY